MKRLSNNQHSILIYMAKYPGGVLAKHYPVTIAIEVDKKYAETCRSEWSAPILQELEEQNYVKSHVDGYYRITIAGIKYAKEFGE